MPNETKSKDESDNTERMEPWDVEEELKQDPYRLRELQLTAVTLKLAYNIFRRTHAGGP